MTESPTPYVLDADTMTGGMRPIRQAVIALGSNLGERLQRLQGGVAAIEDTPEVKIVAISSVYETAPVDSPPDSRPVPERGRPHRHDADRSPAARPGLGHRGRVRP